MKNILRLFVAVATVLGLWTASAETGTIAVKDGGSVSYTGASRVMTLEGGDVVLVFTDTVTAGTFTLEKNAHARIVTVGGGGAGGSLAAVDQMGAGSAGGGGAGGVSDHAIVLSPGTYTADVGAGGRRVQTIVQSWAGANGENSTVLRGEQALLSGKGGGGGGSVKVNGRGEDGGSGGGGSWYGEFTKAGKAVDGQGWAGAVPATTACGGGGGGAAKTATDGTGKSDGTPGAGRSLDITGETVVYGRGGQGGQRASGTAEALDGAGYGWGGDGANVTGRGGAGGDGIIVVRITRLFEYVKVQQPTVSSFTWAAETTFTAFDLATVAEPLKSAIDYVEGVTSTNTWREIKDGVEVHGGVGRYNYAIHLKDEYVWNDGTTTGSTKPFVAYWRVNEPGTVDEATVEVTKTVEWSEGNQATIAINVKTHPERIAYTPKILVMGSLCGYHGLTADVIRQTINSCAAVGDVDYFYFERQNTDASTDEATQFKGSVAYGQTLNREIKAHDGSNSTSEKDFTTSIGGNHTVLYGFYRELWKAIEQKTEYDYVVLSFDRSLVAAVQVPIHPKEKEVAEYMAKLYNNNAVVWLVDDSESTGQNYDATLQKPWVPSPMASGRDGWGQTSVPPWRTLDWYAYARYKSSAGTSWGYKNYNALIGMFSPADYPVDETKYKQNLTINTSNGNLVSDFVARCKTLKGSTVAPQEVYSDAAKVATKIRSVVKAKPATIAVQDNVRIETGLKLDGDTGGRYRLQKTRDDAEQTTYWDDWAELTATQLAMTANGVTVTIPNVACPAEIDLWVKVTDQGTFRSSLDAVYNEQTNLWEKDPNNGPVTASLTPDGSEKVLAEAKAATAVAWSFPTYQIKGTVVTKDANGNPTGELVINGFVTNKLDVAEGATPEVVFRGKGGYVLDTLKVDGQVITNFDPNLYNWVFNEVGANHEIEVGFKSVFTTPYPTIGSVTKEYDGTPAQPTVTTPTFITGYDYEWKAAYSLSENGPFTTDAGQVNVARDDNGKVVSTPVYVRIWVNQPGYEDGVVIDYWTDVDNVTITPREITVKFDDYAQTSDKLKTTGFDYSLVEGSLVAGDTLVENDGQCTSSPTKGNKTVASITADGTMTVTTPGYEGCNYSITVQPGDYYYPNLDLVAKATNVNKVYDGEAVQTEVTVLYPVGAQTKTATSDWEESDNREGHYNHTRTRTVQQNTLAIEYAKNDAGYESTNPTFTDVGTWAVRYRVNYTERSWTETQTRNSNKNDAWTSSVISQEQSIPYKTYNGTATIVIAPRPVTVIAGSAEKEYDGTALTQTQYTVSEATAGFVSDEGFASVPMTADSTLTNPGTHANKIDQSKVTFASGTKGSNYAITYVDGLLKVEANPLKASATSVVKVYDGSPADNVAVTVVDSHGKALPAGSYTITYKTSPTGTESATLPAAPTEAGEYAVFYTVNGGAGYGVVSGVTTIKINPRTVTLQAADATKVYDGQALASAGFAVVAGEGTGFVGNDGVTAVTMTAASTITAPGTTPNVINVYDTEHWTMAAGTKVQNYTFTTLPGTLTVTRKTAYSVKGDGEFSWTDAAGGTAGQTVIVKVDGVEAFRYTTDSTGRERVIHVTDLPGEANDGATHTIEFVYPNESDTSLYVAGIDWEPAAGADEMYNIVTTDPPTTPVEELKKVVDITNDPESGWMPLYKEDGTMALRSPDGSEGDQNLTSTFSLEVTGSGEIKVSSITIPVSGTDNPDGGVLTIYVDDKPYVIPPEPDESVSYTITRVGDTYVIKNLVIKVTGDSDADHTIDFVYTRTATDASGANTSAIVEGIVWKTYGETDDGGTSWLQGKELMIVDHEPLTAGWVYLAFKPTLKVPEEIAQWVTRSVANHKLKVKYGATRALCNACTPVEATLSDKHEVTAEKVWVRVKVEDLVPASATAASESVGYWRIYVDASAVAESQSSSGSGSLQRVSLLAEAVPTSAPAEESGAESVNTFGILKIESTAKETMIAVPWTWYSKTEGAAQDIPVKKLVKTANLTRHDMIYVWVADGTYAAWWLDETASGELDWVPCTSVRIDSLGRPVSVTADDEDAPLGEQTSVARGNGMWLVRQKPVDANGKAVPFWIYGQSVTGGVETTIPGVAADGDKAVGTAVSIGSPYAVSVRINDLVFEGTPGANDTILVPSDTGVSKYLVYTEKGWRWSTTKVVAGRVRTSFDYDVTVPAGRAFWYVRREFAPLKVKWPQP